MMVANGIDVRSLAIDLAMNESLDVQPLAARIERLRIGPVLEDVFLFHKLRGS